MENLYTTVGAGFKDKMKIIFQYKKQQEDQTQGNRPLIENLARKCNMEPKEENIKWLEYLYRENGIDMTCLLYTSDAADE